jgi:hypothetical protein
MAAPEAADEAGIGEEPDFEEKLDEKPKSILLSMMKQLRTGMDLSKVTLPTFILEPRSFLEKCSDYMLHGDTYLYYMYVSMCACVCVCVCVCMCAHKHMYIHTYIHIYRHDTAERANGAGRAHALPDSLQVVPGGLALQAAWRQEALQPYPGRGLPKSI